MCQPSFTPPLWRVPLERIEHQDDLFRLLATGIGKAFILARDHKATFLQHADRSDVVFSGAAKERARLILCQKGGKSAGGDTLAPIAFAEPISDLALPELFKARHTANHLTIHNNRLV